MGDSGNLESRAHTAVIDGMSQVIDRFRVASSLTSLCLIAPVILTRYISGELLRPRQLLPHYSSFWAKCVVRDAMRLIISIWYRAPSERMHHARDRDRPLAVRASGPGKTGAHRHTDGEGIEIPTLAGVWMNNFGQCPFTTRCSRFIFEYIYLLRTALTTTWMRVEVAKPV